MSKFLLSTIGVATALLNEASAVVKVPVRRRVVDAAVLAEVLGDLPKIPSVNLLGLPSSERVPTHDEVYGQMSMLEAMDKFTKLANKSLLAQVGKIRKSGMIQQRSAINKVTVESDGKSSLRAVHRHSQEEVADKQSPSTQTAYVALHSTIEKINELMEQTVTGDEVQGLKCAEEERNDKTRCADASSALTDAQAQATALSGSIQEVTLSLRQHKQEWENANMQKHLENISFTDVKTELDKELATLPVDLQVCGTILDKISDCNDPSASSAFLQVASENLQCKQCQGGQQVAEIGGDWKAELSKMSSTSGKEALKDLLGGSKTGILLGVRQAVQRLPVSATAGAGELCPMENEVIDPEDRGVSYKGCQNRTTEGNECEPWTANYSAKFGADLANHSYCRNPDPEGGKYTIWCFVKPELSPLGWESCLPVQPPHGFGEPSFDCDTENSGCKLTEDSCNVLVEKFSDTKALLSDALVDVTKNNSDVIALHEKEVAEFNSILTGATNMIQAAGAKLTELQSAMHRELAKMKEQTGLYNEARADFMDHQGGCCKGKKERLSERCALEKVRASVAAEGNMSVYDCVLGEWEDHGGCFTIDEGGQAIEKACLNGAAEKDLVVMRQQTRAIESNPLNGINCENLTQQIECKLELCPVNCVMSEWSLWSECTATCNSGSRTRQRNPVVARQGEGEECPPEEDSQSCNNDPCDVDCELEYDFPEYDNSQCSKPCTVDGDGPGHHERIRGIRVPPKGGGKECPDERLECNENNQQTCRLQTAPCNGEKMCGLNMTTGLVSCNGQLDVLVMLDSSGSLRTSGWKAEVSAVIPMLRAMGEDVQANVVIWSGPNYGKTPDKKTRWSRACRSPGFADENPKKCGVQWVNDNFTPDKEQLVAKLEDAIDNTNNNKNLKIGFMNSMTYSGKALEKVQGKLASGMGRPGVDKVVVLVIDGRPTDRSATQKKADVIKATGAKVEVLAIGGAARSKSITRALKQLVSDPKEDNLVVESSFARLINPQTINKVLVRACQDIELQPRPQLRR